VKLRFEQAFKVVRDLLKARLRWYLGGKLMTRLFVTSRLRRFFAFRHAELERLIHEQLVIAKAS